MHYPDWFTSPSSVDFCESNFSEMEWIAEPYNTVSALPLIGLGFLGMTRCLKAKDGSGPEMALFAMLVVLGFGTIALHATLTSLGQVVDEIPMTLLTLWLAAQIETARGATGLGGPVGLLSVMSSLAYIKFQDFYTCFILSYSSLVAYIVLRLGWLALSKRPDPRLDKIRQTCIRPLFLFGVASYVLFGFFAWITDMLLCDSVSKLLFGKVLLHPLWHVGSGLGSWCAMYASIAAREEFRLSKGIGAGHVKFKWLFLVLPCVDHGALLLSEKKKAL